MIAPSTLRSHVRDWALALAATLLGHGTALAEEIDVGGLTREYQVVTPASARTPAPTVIILHGGAGKARQIHRHAGFDALAAREGVVTVYPQGVGGHWNDGRVNAPEANFSAEDDVGFLRALVARLTAEGVADPARVYMTGISNGGFMTLRVACEAPELIAGAAVVAANQPAPAACAPAEPTPIVFFHGTEDEWVPWAGGEVATQARGYRGEALSVHDTLALWRDIDGCRDGTRETLLPDRAPRDGLRVRVIEHRGCAAPLTHVVVEGGGHTWPGARPRLLMRRLVGPTTQDIDASEAMWRFWTTGSVLE